MGDPSQSQQRSERLNGLPDWDTALSGQCQSLVLCKGFGLGREELVLLHYELMICEEKNLHALKRCGYNIWVCKGLPDGNSNELQGI